jgi:MFS family permease
VVLDPVDLQRAQRRVVRVLAGAQVLGGVGVAAGIAVGALIAADLGSDSLSGLASASSVIGAALIAVPVARVMDVHGRRRGLLLAYAVGTLGALLVIGGTALELLPLALLGLMLAGGGTTAGLQSRFAATDLATQQNRGRSLSTVVWATTVGSVLGPNLAQPMGDLAESMGAPRLAGPYMLTVVAFVVAAGLIAMLLRPDPLLVARAEAARASGHDGDTSPAPRKRLRAVLSEIAAVPAASMGLLAMASGHAVMVGVMSMTPLHLQHGDASLRIIGLVISGHVAGMYIASPLVGVLADRFGRRIVIVAGAALLLTAVAIAGSSSGHESSRLAVGLVFLGLGWSCTLIAGSTLLTEAFALDDRPRVQGAADLVMGIAGASAGLLSGVVVGVGSYALLNVIAALVVATLMAFSVRGLRSGPMAEGAAR